MRAESIVLEIRNVSKSNYPRIWGSDGRLPLLRWAGPQQA